MLPDAGKDANRDPCASSPTQRHATEGEETSEVGSCRSMAVGVASSSLGAMALSIGYRQTGDGDRLAAKRFSALLDLEEQSR